MNKLLLTTSFVLIYLCSCGQQPTIEQKQIGNEIYILPSIEAFTYLFELSLEDWESLMIKYGYKIMDESKGIITYYKGEIGNQVQAVAKNKTGVLSIDWFNLIDKTKLTKEIEKSLKSYFVESGNGFNYYYYDKYVIGIKVTENEFLLHESILIKNK